MFEIEFDENEIIFPLKALYDRAHGTLEGLSAPYGSVGDVAPQGLADLGVPDLSSLLFLRWLCLPSL